MIHKEFIPYEQALALKELGFDEPCFGWFILEGDGAKSMFVPEKCPKQDIGLCLAPTFSQAFRWFRENHYLDSWVYCSDETKGYFGIIVSGKRLVFYNENRETYEAAELACLKRLMETIKGQ